MQLSYGLFELACYFVIYSFLGWCTEVVFKAVNTGKFVNRGFLNGPVCPIYGFGVVIVLALLTPLRDNLLVLFVGSVLLTTALEYVVGFILEKAFNDKWWDYSHEHFNIKGYVCLKFSLLWGLACIFVINIVQPIIDVFVVLIPPLTGKVIVTVLIAAFVGDAILSISSAWTLKKRLRLLDELGHELRHVSDSLGEKLSDKAIIARERGEAAAARAEERREAVLEKAENNRAKLDELRNTVHARNEDNRERREELKKRYAALLNEKHFGHKRLLKAFADYGKRSGQPATDLRQRMNKTKTKR